MPPNPDPLDPVALDTSPAQAFASHKATGKRHRQTLRDAPPR